MKNRKNKSAAIVAIAFVVGGLLGWSITTGYYVKDNHEGNLPEIAIITIGEMEGLPPAVNGQFRIRTCDELLVTDMTRREYDVVRPMAARLRHFRNRPPPGGTNGVKTLQ